VKPFACYFCKKCDCEKLHYDFKNAERKCETCNHSSFNHISFFNRELLKPIQEYGNAGLGIRAFEKLRLLTDRIMLRRVKRDHAAAMELPPKDIRISREFFSDVEKDLAQSVMSDTTRQFDRYVARGVLLNNYANIFGLIMQMRQIADHPDLILAKNVEGGQNILVCCKLLRQYIGMQYLTSIDICGEVAEEPIRAKCHHTFCRDCVKSYIASFHEMSTGDPECPKCHITMAIDLEQATIEQDEDSVKKSSIINRIQMDSWTSSTKIEMLVHELYLLRKPYSTTKSIIFSNFTSMLQLIEWRLHKAGIRTVMLDGSMTPIQRANSIRHFMTVPECEVFLVSLKAGGVALNLTEASRVYLVDPLVHQCSHRS
jgi:DNA repair protein RAD16